MSAIRINRLKLKNFRSFGTEQTFNFADAKKPIAIIGYNNAGKTNLMNALRYGLYESVYEETFTVKDFHNCSWDNPPFIELDFMGTDLGKDLMLPAKYTNSVSFGIGNQSIKSVRDVLQGSNYSKKYQIKQNAAIFYVNFHNIKDEISTQKTSWGTLRSFLGKHIKKIVDNDETMKKGKPYFKTALEKATSNILHGIVDIIKPEEEGSVHFNEIAEIDMEPENITPVDTIATPPETELKQFINAIQSNYSTNLRDNTCVIDFGLPNYEDIFLQMMFKVGLNGDENNLIPISHFGDGFISMFVMAVIQAIAETNKTDKCLFLFEEPESFLHENHQEYFYRTVLCSLAEKGHQVIYSTHSDKMLNIFDTQSYIRLEYERVTTTTGNDWQTVNKYNSIDKFSPHIPNIHTGQDEEGVNIKYYTQFITSLEPNLNKILFSKKVILVEGPNDVMVYKFLIRKGVKDRAIIRMSESDSIKYGKTYLNFENISIIPHHGKSTAILLIQLCKHIGVDYYVINDWDFKTDFREELENGVDLEAEEKWKEISAELNKKGTTHSLATLRAMITNLRKIQSVAVAEKLHFNLPKLESVMGYDFDDKDSKKMFDVLINMDPIPETVFPKSLVSFLEIDKIPKAL
ncbi:AAA family ATPase [Dyadobacter sp. 32]|uniref:ATP-dependent nuclease n=1 Tax=Dyadobacter sp. 32 TaxID=538966 RepID=UPI0011EE5A37